jgi:hypothetical protein
MSGWERGWDCPAFGLTWTKAKFWHRRCECGVDPRDDGFLGALYDGHLAPLGFERLEPSPSSALLVLTWPGIVQGASVDQLYDAVHKQPAKMI